MELSKLTICRQDVIVLSDSETQGNEEEGGKPKKKTKRKIECIRKVQLTRMTVERSVPYCYRKRCRSAQYYHRMTSKNTKYTENGASAVKVEKQPYTNQNNNNESQIASSELSSPITVKSSSVPYEPVSPYYFNTASSDSDELEDLIKHTRQRMKNEKDLIKTKKSTSHATKPQNRTQNNLTTGSPDGSIHSMDTVVIKHKDAMFSPISSRTFSESSNADVRQILHSPHHVESPRSITPSVVSQKSNSLSPIFEISGKVFMEHYLNTSI